MTSRSGKGRTLAASVRTAVPRTSGRASVRSVKDAKTSMTESPEGVKKCGLRGHFLRHLPGSLGKHAFRLWRHGVDSTRLLLVTRQAAAGGGAFGWSPATLVLRLLFASC